MSEAVKRTIRTFVQAFLGSIITSGVLSSINTEGVVKWDVVEKVLISAMAAAIIASFALVMNLLEDNTQFPALLKSSPPALNPVPDAGPEEG